ncbi:MAG: hypothetical protein V3T72_02765, partial [Thermoanaerobaculia bacterium]
MIAEIDVGPSLERIAHPETIRTLVEERLLPEGLVNRLHALYPQYFALETSAAPLFTGKDKYAG